MPPGAGLGGGGLTLLLETNGTSKWLPNLLNLQQGTNVTLTDNGSGQVTIAASAGGTVIQGITVSSVTPVIGDTFRYNEYGDSKWDVCCGVPNFIRIQIEPLESASPGLAGIGVITANATIIGTLTFVAATATEPTLLTAGNSSALGNTSVTGITHYGFNTATSAGTFSIGTLRRYSTRWRPETTAATSRFWLGLGGYMSDFNTTGWVSDTPNTNYAAFRWSSAVDTNIQAVVATDNTHQTVVDTGIAPNTTNTGLFEIAWAGAAFKFFINGTLVATISTNLPATSTLMIPFLSCDNNNTATKVTFSFEYFQLTLA